MITINLLPEELRPLEKTPLGRFIVMVLGIALTVSALFLFLSLRIRTLPLARQERDNAEATKKQKEELAKRYDELETEIAFFKLRIDTVKAMRKERLIWSKKLHELHKVIAEDSPDVALNRVSIMQGAVGRGVNVPRVEIVIDGYSIIPELKSAADFMKNLRKSDFFKGCEDINPENTVVRDGEKGQICAFSLRVLMKPRVQPPQPEKKGRRP